MVALIAVLIGFVSMQRLPIDLLPEISFPTLTVSVSYGNAGPEEMEELVARPLERALAAVPGVEQIDTTTAEGTAQVRLRFSWGADLNVASNDVRDRLDRVTNALPEDASRPSIRRFDPSNLPILIVGVSSNIDPIELRSVIDNQIIYRLQQVPGVAAVDVWGGPDREIQVNLNYGKIQALGLSLADVQRALRAANLNLPGGVVERGNYQLTLRTPGRFTDLEQIADTVVAVRDGAPISVGEIAAVIDTQRRETRRTRINQEAGVRLAVRKQSDANTVEASKAVKQAVERLRQDYPQITFAEFFDTALYIQRSIDNVGRSILFGGTLAILVLLAFLRRVRATAVIAVAIPVAIITTFSIVYFGGFTLNLMTLGGLALGVGLMVDSAIVVLENISRRYEQEGESLFQAAIQGTGEMAPALVASTLTTLAIFVPMLFTEDLSGQLFQQLAYVVAFALACSLVVALTVVPMLAARLLGQQHAPSGWLGRLDARMASGLQQLEQAYGYCLNTLLRCPRRVIAVVIVCFIASMSLVPRLGTEFLPAGDEGEVRVDLRFDSGTRLDVVDRQTQRLEARMAELIPERSAMLASSGSGGWRPGSGGRADVRVELPPASERPRPSQEVAASLRQALTDIPGARVRVRVRQPFFLRILSGGGGDESIEVEVRGYDFAVLDALAQQVQQRLSEVSGITDTRLSREQGEPRELIRVDRRRAADQGLSVEDIARTVETAVAGGITGQFIDRGEEVDIRVRLADSEKLSSEQLLNLQIVGSDGRLVRLGNVARLEDGTGPSVIDRKNQQRLAVVYANIGGRDLGSVVADVRQQLNSIAMPRGYDAIVGGSYEEQEAAFNQLIVGLLLAVLLVYMVMASLYESLRDPLVVMFSVPFALIGVVLVLLLTNTTLNAQSLLGCLMLVGIVVNNAILIVDQTNRLRTEGMDVLAALQAAGQRRLRPILMTSLTTALALIPLAIGLGEGAEQQAPLARAVIGGMVSATFITLLVIPVIYAGFHRAWPARAASA
jgi:HAE1 family hydrophobic/amphiphilic exporter-1